MGRKKDTGIKKGKKKPWKKPDFEIHSLLDENFYIRGMVCDGACPCDCTCDPGS